MARDAFYADLVMWLICEVSLYVIGFKHVGY